jgi:hypothetical protein
MTFKKMLLLASMALAAIAFSVPASASALEWTHNGAEFEGEVEDTLSGSLFFGNPEAGQTKFGCNLHIGIIAHGGTTTSTSGNISRTTETCAGEGAFTGCELVEDETTGLPADVHTTGTNTLTITGPIVIHNVYDEDCPIVRTTLTFPDVTITLQNSNLTDVVVNALAESHTTIRSPTVEVTQTVAFFGTVGTATDTLSIQ